MSLNWTHQHKRMTGILKQRRTGLRESHALPGQTISISNTAVLPSLVYAFPVVPCNHDQLNLRDNNIGGLIKYNLD